MMELFLARILGRDKLKTKFLAQDGPGFDRESGFTGSSTRKAEGQNPKGIPQQGPGCSQRHPG